MSAAGGMIEKVNALQNLNVALREETDRLRAIIALALAEYDDCGGTSEFPPKDHWTHAARRVLT